MNSNSPVAVIADLPYPFLYQKERGGSAGPPDISRTVVLMNMKFCMALRNIFQHPRNGKTSFIVIKWLPQQLLKYNVFYQ